MQRTIKREIHVLITDLLNKQNDQFGGSFILIDQNYEEALEVPFKALEIIPQRNSCFF